jgi:hypothetical protein
MQYVIQGKTGLKSVNINRRKAIRERCLNCSGWSARDVKECEFSDCQLYPFHTGQGKQDPKARNNAIRKNCLWCVCGQRAEVAKCPSFDCSLFPYRGVRKKPLESISIRKKGRIGVTSE